MVDLGKLLGGGFDTKKLQQVIDLVWDNKDDLANSAQFAKDIPDLIRTLASGPCTKVWISPPKSVFPSSRRPLVWCCRSNAIRNTAT